MKKYLFGFLLLISTLSFSQEKKDSIPPAPPKWKVTGLFTFLFNQSTFTNWKAGGDNTIAGNIGVNYDFNYKSGKWNWDNRIITVYGLSNIQEAGVRKTNDRFEYNSLLGLKSNKYWFFSFFLNFKTQYTKGYDDRESPRLLVSDFFSPAYLSFGPGMLWKRSDDITINIAPATSRFTFVNDHFSGKYGVNPGENVKFALGFSLSGYLNFEVLENINMQNIIALYSNYLNKAQNVDVDYQAKFSTDINKYMTTNVIFHMLIDDNASSKIQLKQIFGLGLKYVFHKK
ncbi:hypothetical protein KCTC32516_00703 [Polaribacter huanghezhanensis]|uniref:DUF3078 domain-containing protein n=1 Tax=Polaribacter huanghezhanensis TaxID=1354726 RepID=UPI002648BE4F|nr:DUF3078 domain-containing protein [Polaribacter huanghezhanensis]WKD85363.1 hypothetical protein KCTC32516_00703 [Polaribacter huanghezhanensis]